MKHFSPLFFFLTLIAGTSCQNKIENKQTSIQAQIFESGRPAIVLAKSCNLQIADSPKTTAITPKKYKAHELVELTDISSNFDYELRYATTNNVFKQKLYTCSKCLLRYEVALALIKANDALIDMGYHIKIFDAYRPASVSLKMWEIWPNKNYVKNPHTGPSMHNCGTAVDITLVDMQGKELDMGTDFDYFGKKAHHAYTKFPEEVIRNRKLLKHTMENVGFRSIRTEWWHYSFKKNYPALNKPLPCSNDK